MASDDSLLDMRKSDVTCPKCHAGYRRIELATRPGMRGEFRCCVCDHLLERFDGSSEVALRLTVPPEKYRDDGYNRFSNPSP
jgi:transposase-like protein